MTFNSPENFHNRIGFVFHALLALPLTVFVYLFLEMKHDQLAPVVEDAFMRMLITYIFPVVATAVMLLAYSVFRKNIKALHINQSLKDKLELYYGFNIRIYIATAIASVLLVGGLYLTGSAVFILGYVFLLFFMSLNRPTQQKYVKDLPLRPAQKDVLLHKGTFEEAERTID